MIVVKYNWRNPVICICFMHIRKAISVVSWLDSKSVSSDMHIDFEEVAALSVKHSWFLSVLSLRLISHIMVRWPFNSCKRDSLSLEQGILKREKRKNKEKTNVLDLCCAQVCSPYEMQRYSDSKPHLFISSLRNREEMILSFLKARNSDLVCGKKK